MKILFYALILSIFVLLILLSKNSKLNIFITLICSFLIIKIVLNPKICIEAALNGAKLFINSVFPSLFPFLVIINVMMEFGGIEIYSKIFGTILCKPLNLPNHCSFPILVSFICGYPLGAKYSCELYENKSISLSTCERLLNIASNAGPLFVIGGVGASMLNNHYLGYLLLISNYISCFIMALLLKRKDFNAPSINKHFNRKSPKADNIGLVLKRSIENSIFTTLSIGGFIILFSVLTILLKNSIFFSKTTIFISNILHIPINLTNGFIIGLMEMTNGCASLSSIKIDMIYKLAFLSFIISFGGISITSQVYSFTYKYNISMKKYMKRKFIQGFISSITTVLMYKLFYNPVVFTSTFFYNASFNNVYFIKLIIILIALTILPYILKRKKFI
ncbi:sporulation integral membrane protein YlbJ [Haloimpatiens massiliensis]|uniref:sporulation integral membrane protein YlbJ n=1 Tax=Haloimpatiens massiliensis TaxID=1658110 RepID=UPI000C84924E|nr:sporulation integral membrane protein YlbJ [Haloimpatiens massiliensis]